MKWEIQQEDINQKQQQLKKDRKKDEVLRLRF
jgi:hypothetical protein